VDVAVAVRAAVGTLLTLGCTTVTSAVIVVSDQAGLVSGADGPREERLARIAIQQLLLAINVAR